MNLSKLAKQLAAIAQDLGWELIIASEGDDVMGIVVGDPLFLDELMGPDEERWSPPDDGKGGVH